MTAGPEAHFDLAAAGFQADESDVRAGIEVLARKLEIALPQACRVQRRRSGLLDARKRVTAIHVELGRSHLWLRVKRDSVHAGRVSQVHDMRRREETLGLAEWLRAVEDELRAAADSSREASEALDRLLDA